MTPRILLLTLSLLLPALAGAGDYTGNAQLATLVEELAKEGLDRDATRALLESAERKQAILDAIARPAEKALSWGEYRPRFVEQKRIDQGLAFWNEHADTLERAEATYGVPAEMIVAIIGVETRYGRNKGSWRVIDALSTLAWDYPPRATFFRDQLKQFVLLAREAHIDPATLTGSYAGAMGFPQFMPSSYRAYSADFDNDGVTDLVNNPVDAIGSVAKYFRAHNWKTGAPVAVRAIVEGEGWRNVVNQGLDLKYTVADLEKAGMTPLSCITDEIPSHWCADPGPRDKVNAWQLDGEKGAEFWIGLHNFYVITRYNRSEKYALAALQLSHELHEARRLERLAAE